MPGMDHYEKQMKALRGMVLATIREIVATRPLSGMQRAAWIKMAEGVARIPVVLHGGRENLRAGRDYVIKGENITLQALERLGKIERVRTYNYIQMGKGHLFTQDGKLKFDGAITLFHEWAHNGGGERFADLMSVNLGVYAAMKMGFDPMLVKSHLMGRKGVIGEKVWHRLNQVVDFYSGLYRSQGAEAVRAKILKSAEAARRQAERRDREKHLRMATEMGPFALLPPVSKARERPDVLPGMPKAARLAPQGAKRRVRAERHARR